MQDPAGYVNVSVTQYMIYMLITVCYDGELTNSCQRFANSS